MTTTTSAPARYTVVSADGHAGGDIQDYRPYLARRWHDDFDAWAAEYVNPYADLLAPIAYRSWDSDRRLAETESDGIAAEVLFPNTVPPFFAEGNLVALPPTPEDYERRWAGVQAHNRWLAEFCAHTPGRRAGIVQVFANDIDDAVAEIRWAAENLDPFGGILLPSIPPTRTCLLCGRSTTSRCGGCVPSSTYPSTSTAAARCPTTGSTSRPGR